MNWEPDGDGATIDLEGFRAEVQPSDGDWWCRVKRIGGNDVFESRAWEVYAETPQGAKRLCEMIIAKTVQYESQAAENHRIFNLLIEAKQRVIDLEEGGQ